MQKQWVNISLAGIVALSSPLIVQAGALAQTLSTERAMELIQSEAAVQLNTYPGNIAVTEFQSSRNAQQGLVGYTATVQAQDGNIALFCSVDLNQIVACRLPEVIENAQCGPERRQEDILDLQFTQNRFITLNDYAVRIYNNIDDIANVSYLCMNIYDVRNSVFIGAIPARASGDVTAFYSDGPVDGIDYQVILTPDNGYIFRRSQGTELIYEGFSR